jgi:hypothetical protein
MGNCVPVRRDLGCPPRGAEPHVFHRADAKLYVAAVPGAKDGVVATVWIAGEMTRGLITGSTTSTTAEIEVTAAGTTATAQVAIAAGDGGFVTP